MGIATDHGEYRPREYFISDFSGQELSIISNAGFETHVLIEDVSAHYQQQNSETSTALYRLTQADPDVPHFAPGSYGGYFTYDEMLAVFAQMHELYPDLVTAVQPIDAFRSVEGRPIYWLKISGNVSPAAQNGKPQVLYTALHHAREPGSLSQMIYFMWYLLDNYQQNEKVKAILEGTELYFIPCVNPDGYLYNIGQFPGTGGMWRKNRRLNANGTYGVDLNRNYGYSWGYGSSNTAA